MITKPKKGCKMYTVYLLKMTENQAGLGNGFDLFRPSIESFKAWGILGLMTLAKFPADTCRQSVRRKLEGCCFAWFCCHYWCFSKYLWLLRKAYQADDFGKFWSRLLEATRIDHLFVHGFLECPIPCSKASPFKDQWQVIGVQHIHPGKLLSYE